MLTLFSIPKAFAGETGELQREAVRSWASLRDTRVILFGDDDGVAEAAGEAGVEHVAEIAREGGTPRLDDAFRRAHALAGGTLLCFVNADILLGDDLLDAVASVSARPFLLVGQSIDVDPAELLGRPLAEQRVAATRRGTPRGPTAIDYFVFTPGLFDPIPPFVVGRAGFDNWLIWRARRSGPVVDATGAVVALHPRHGYDHVPGGKSGAYYGPEAQRNVRLAGGRKRIYTLHDASHRLTADGRLTRNLGATMRVRETIRKVGWKLGVR